MDTYHLRTDMLPTRAPWWKAKPEAFMTGVDLIVKSFLVRIKRGLKDTPQWP